MPIYFDNIYCLREGIVKNALRIEDKDNTFNWLDLLLGKVRPEQPIVYKQTGGRELVDLADAVMDRIVSDRFIQVLKNNNFTGWDTFPVQTFSRKKEIIPGYHGLVVIGKCGKFDYSNGKKVWKMPPVRGGKSRAVLVGASVNPETWDGSDIFLPEGTGVILILEKVKRALEDAEITNVDCTPLKDMFHNIEALISQGDLSAEKWSNAS